jgi:hypothetical protein
MLPAISLRFARAIGDPIFDHDDSATCAFHRRATFFNGEAPLFLAFT